MPFFRLDGTIVHINFGRGRNQRVKPCYVCLGFAMQLCDWRLPDGTTCSAPICTAHSFKPGGGDKDICPWHEGPAKAWLASRTNSTDGTGP